MNTTAAGSVLVGQQAALRELHNARPHAPVVPHAAGSRLHLRRTRRVTAAALHRVAHRVAPAT